MKVYEFLALGNLFTIENVVFHNTMDFFHTTYQDYDSLKPSVIRNAEVNGWSIKDGLLVIDYIEPQSEGAYVGNWSYDD